MSWDADLIVGEEFSSKLMQQIDSAAAIIVFVTENSAQSDWVEKEVTHARERRIPVLPVRINDAELPDFAKHWHALSLHTHENQLAAEELDEVVRQLGIYLESGRELTERDVRRYLAEPAKQHGDRDDRFAKLGLAGTALLVVLILGLTAYRAYPIWKRNGEISIGAILSCPTGSRIEDEFVQFDADVRERFFGFMDFDDDRVIREIEGEREKCRRNMCESFFDGGRAANETEARFLESSRELCLSGYAYCERLFVDGCNDLWSEAESCQRLHEVDYADRLAELADPSTLETCLCGSPSP